jgi:hypothetical protein
VPESRRASAPRHGAFRLTVRGHVDIPLPRDNAQKSIGVRPGSSLYRELPYPRLGAATLLAKGANQRIAEPLLL